MEKNWQIIESEIVDKEFVELSSHEFCGSVEEVKSHLVGLVHDWSMLEYGVSLERSTTSSDELLVLDDSITAAVVFDGDVHPLALTAFVK